MFFLVLINPLGNLTIATGRTDLEFQWSLFMFFIMPIVIFISAHFSVEIVALSMTNVVLVLFVPLWYFVINRMIKTNLKEYIKAHIPDFMILKELSKMLLKR